MKKIILFVFFSFTFSANAALINSYDFNGNLSDTLNTGVDLVASGGTLDSERYTFTANQGLRLSSALPSTTEYGIEIKFKVSDSVAGYNKVIDFQDLASDRGLYINAGKVDLYTVGSSVASVAVGNDYILGFERSGTDIKVFLNGDQLFSAADNNNQAVSANNILNFFEDDNATSQGEAFQGSVDFIRIHNDSTTFGTSPVPVPTAEWLFGSGLIGLLGMRKTTKSI